MLVVREELTYASSFVSPLNNCDIIKTIENLVRQSLKGFLSMAKLYIDGGVTVVRAAQKYLTRWQPKMVLGASPAQIAALTSLISCIADFLVEWHKIPPVN